MPLGATVEIRVDPRTVGQLLHRLENRLDIHLLHRRDTFSITGKKTEVWQLRSDIFPSDWEGRTVHAIIGTESSGVLEFRE